ncbi:uncharacterized protein EV420DRAFT_1639583 [Desarmillaria tabescens]|uniref:Cysteine-rich transmembrane CYSTM domain-containing protein n=1 Tax=Armillaria tabescens TaxID=1929756 RepID=A0AA39NB34_ARMTA|nr:uncharacterized protein EV420DRAFT_1639583 [Desarmillaria tabescens]KAK0462362.1 hypothetical protein EV420DRAFT_1639583 [Desarmillaria tabescens]
MSYYPPQGAPGQGGYYPQPPPQAYGGGPGYMPQQQPQTIIVQQEPQKSDDSNCCMACLAGMCCFCCLESICD